ncbi:MAG: porin [Gammaproteobacteria bacterium HGW-Gammaproteobacteria-10]|nr:MAG: porin [Gammaproteobacteria bacterium HGW-Gammaproteobacteria-10]
MKFKKLSIAIMSVLGAAISPDAASLELYVDNETKQLYAEPGPNRTKLGDFERVDDKALVKADNAIANQTVSGTETMQGEQTLPEDMSVKMARVRAVDVDPHVDTRAGVHTPRKPRKKVDDHWFDRINLRGYTQLRYNHAFTGDRVGGSSTNPELRSVMDGGVKDNQNFTLRRVRLVIYGDISNFLYLYIQPDFATSVRNQSGGETRLHYVQLRDAYADIYLTKDHEYRIRAGQSKVPFGWENLQSSQNRLALDRNDALNSAVPSERDLGLFAYYTPEHVQKLWKDLSKKGLKTSGDYGVLGVGIYNGQSLNREEANDGMYVVAHSTYPLDLGFMGDALKGQVLEIGADAFSGKFKPTFGNFTTFDKSIDISGSTIEANSGKNKSFTEERVAVHAILFPQPFGFQAEWNWGNAGALNVDTATIEKTSLSGGYVQAMYKIDDFYGTWIPYVKWQTYRGMWKANANMPKMEVDELEIGVEWQVMKALELVVNYSHMDRTNMNNSAFGQASGDVVRAQLQWNYY